MTTTVIAKPIYPDNAHLARVDLTRWSPSSGSVVPWTGAVGTVGIYADEEGAEPLPSLGPVALTEAPGSGGTYYAEFPAADVTAGLDGKGDGATVYQIVKAGLADELDTVQPLRVTLVRPPVS
jgi:hypothetical protein